VAKSEWSDTARVRDWVIPSRGLDSGCYWIIDDTGFPKKGKHSVGVVRQYCGQLGKQDNCQVAVSLSLASVQGSIPIAYRLYLPKTGLLTRCGASPLVFLRTLPSRPSPRLPCNRCVGSARGRGAGRRRSWR